MLSCVEGGINTDPYHVTVQKKCSLVVSVPACGMADPNSSLTTVIIFSSSSRYRVVWRFETFRDIGALVCGGEGD